MSEDFWIQKWKKGEIAFHQSKYHQAVELFGDRFSPGTVLVPLCGKTLDMLYFSSMGHSVIGVELSPIACRDFFIENGLQFSERTVPDFIVFESENITLWCGDFFKLPKDIWKTITGIYDRAALIALPPEIRQQYAAEIAKQCVKGIEILLVSLEFPEGTIQGPPFSVPEVEIKNIYKTFDIQKIHSMNQEFRTTVATEAVYWLH